jgi:sulfur-oxidizing protein SoxB
MPGKALGVDVMTGHWEFTYGMQRVRGTRAEHRTSQRPGIEFHRAERQDRRLRRSGVQALHVIREMNGVPVAIIGQAFPYTPIANPR